MAGVAPAAAMVCAEGVVTAVAAPGVMPRRRILNSSTFVTQFSASSTVTSPSSHKPRMD